MSTTFQSFLQVDWLNILSLTIASIAVVMAFTISLRDQII